MSRWDGFIMIYNLNIKCSVSFIFPKKTDISYGPFWTFHDPFLMLLEYTDNILGFNGTMSNL